MHYIEYKENPRKALYSQNGAKSFGAFQVILGSQKLKQAFFCFFDIKAEKERREQNRREIDFEYAWLLQINLNKVRWMCLYGQLSAKRVEKDFVNFYLFGNIFEQNKNQSDCAMCKEREWG